MLEYIKSRKKPEKVDLLLIPLLTCAGKPLLQQKKDKRMANIMVN